LAITTKIILTQPFIAKHEYCFYPVILGLNIMIGKSCDLNDHKVCSLEEISFKDQ